MKAVQYREIGASPVVVDVPTPEPGPGQVLLKVTASGLCHSDIFVMDLPEEQYIYGLPLTLGHEGVGTVVALGPGATGVEEGQNVAVYGPWGCGTCATCAAGMENYCPRAADLGIAPPGLGNPGSMAEYMIVDSPRHLVPIGDLDPVTTAPLTDAGLTPYHAIKRFLPKLGAGSTAVVIGVGGLGHVAIQILRALSGAQVIGLDVNQAKLDLATAVGADHAFLSDASAVDAVKDLTDGRGAELVIDCAGFQPTIDLAQQMVAVGGGLSIVGIGAGGAYAKVGFFMTPYEAETLVPYWGYRQELFEVIELAKRGVFDIHTETFGIDEAPQAYARLREGTLEGRAVVVP
ncbi:MAG: NAD(P)-dependent alcohol dehydrogenase [Rhodococcus sp. (in: high G+C Gram-positive bacteria)]|uniref:NAD(P)-dependent alcohol dehydrogenase n=1 Tax=Rhodococcus sp. TaxID=1831 RepID=UPI003BAE92F3